MEDEIISRLLHGVRSGDERAFNQLYATCFSPLYTKVLSMVKDEEIADEIIQELFVLIWQKRESIKPNQSLRGYLYKIAANLVYDFYRKAAKDTRLAQKLATETATSYFHSDLALENKESRALLLEAIEQLSPQRKAVFTSCKLEGNSYEETSKLLGISIATVNSHMTQSFKIVREFILKSYDIKSLLLVLAVLFKKP